MTGCYGAATTKLERKATTWTSQYTVSEKCYINTAKYVRGPYCFGTTCPGKSDRRFIQTSKMGVFRNWDWHEDSEFWQSLQPSYLPNSPIDGQVSLNYERVEPDDVCKQAKTPFGKVNYREFGKMVWDAYDSKNYIAERGPDCAAKCFSKAGCSAFFEGAFCGLFIGPIKSGRTSRFTKESGRIDNGLCEHGAFRNEFESTKQFHQWVDNPRDGRDFDDVLDEIIANSTESDSKMARLNRWTFSTRSSNPPTTVSQRIDIIRGNYYRWDGVKGHYLTFKINTHVRIGHSWAVGTGTFFNGRRKREDGVDETADETIGERIGELTMGEDLRLHDEAIEEQKQADKLRSMMPRTDDILAEIQAIEDEALSFVFDGGVVYPDDIEILETGPIETVQFVQKSSDGSIAADCSTGSCQCSKGFIDNGNGCEEMTPEQSATTTQAPTTKATTTKATTTETTTTNAPAIPDFQALSLDPVRDWIPSLIDRKVRSVFQDNRPGKPRTHLLTKWKKLSDSFVNRFKELASQGCDFADTYEDNSIDFNTINACKVILTFLLFQKQLVK